jgi:RNA polymerase-binding transcription factor DksA
LLDRQGAFTLFQRRPIPAAAPRALSPRVIIVVMRFTPDVTARLRRELMRRGQTLATLLAEVLAGKQPPALEALLAQKPGKRPEEVLRLALDQVEARRRLLDAGDDRYGRCDVCGVDLGEAALAELPWADRCATHAAQ